MPAGGTLRINIGSLVRPSIAQWFNTRSGQWVIAAAVEGETLTLTPPDEEDWVLCIRRDR
jgi:hypothetical protein